MAVKKEEVLTNLTVIKRNGKKMEFKPKKIAIAIKKVKISPLIPNFAPIAINGIRMIQQNKNTTNGADELVFTCALQISIVGAIFPTTTKVKTVLTSTEMLDAICKAVPIPVNAIGGLTKDNLSVLKGIGISGICAVSSIMKAENPQEAAIALKRAFEKEI